jgi:hypothetical protein
MEINSEKLAFFERRMTAIIGLCEILVGIFLISLPLLTHPLYFRIPSWFLAVMTNLGIGLIAAGIITGTLERISRMRLQYDIAEVKQAHLESLLEGLIPVPIFEEIDAHIIRKPFLRKDFRWSFEFTWKDESRKSLRRSAVTQYEVRNVSRIPAIYEIVTIEERTREDQNGEFAYIKEVQIECEDAERSSILSKADLTSYIKERDQYIEMRIPLELQPNQGARVRLSIENIFPDRDVYYCCAAISTIYAELTVAHPDDLGVEAMPMHPSENKFKKEVDTPTLKRWRMEAAILPFQGIELSWRPKARVRQST